MLQRSQRCWRCWWAYIHSNWMWVSSFFLTWLSFLALFGTMLMKNSWWRYRKCYGGGQITYEFGYCLYNFCPYCCAAVVSLVLFPDDPSQSILILNCKRSPRVWRLPVVSRLKSTSLLINDSLREVEIHHDCFVVLELHMIMFLVFKQVIMTPRKQSWKLRCN